MRQFRVWIVTVALLAWMPAYAAGVQETLVDEGWETGLHAWTYEDLRGTEIACDAGHPGCSLRATPPCCSRYDDLYHAIGMPLPSATSLLLSFEFWTTSLTGDTDTQIRLQLDTDHIIIHPSSGTNNGVSIQTGDIDRPFATYPGTHTWYRVELNVTGHNAVARLYDPDGTLRATSPTVSFASSATRVEHIRISSVTWNSRTEFRYDNVRFSLADRCLPFAARLDATGDIGEIPLATTLLPSIHGIAPECGSVAWTLDFGDGSPPLSGTGAPPASVAHEYPDVGTHAARLNATRGTASVSATHAIRALDCLPLALSLGPAYLEGSAPYAATFAPRVTTSSTRCAPSWTLDFGDGSPPLTGTGDAPASLSHVYEAAGHYAARLEATLGSTTKNATVQVLAGPLTQEVSGSWLLVDTFTPILTSAVLASVSGPEDPNPLVGRAIIPLAAPADGSDRIELRWTAFASFSNLDVHFMVGDWAHPTAVCATSGTGGESCYAPIGATVAIVETAIPSAQVEWTFKYHYA